jgi:hypothetical protein
MVAPGTDILRTLVLYKLPKNTIQLTKGVPTNPSSEKLAGAQEGGSDRGYSGSRPPQGAPQRCDLGPVHTNSVVAVVTKKPPI